MIIKCPECGHEVSDMAVKCPNCGYPVTHHTEDNPKRQKNKKWLWISIGLIVVLAVGIVSWLLSKGFDDDPNAIVELTPDFIEKVQQYDKLAPFSEGRAAVRKGNLWGYINTKGDEVIPCQFTSNMEGSLIGAERFHDGMSRVYKDGIGYYINRKGEVIFKGDGGRFSEGLVLLEDGRIVDNQGKTKFSVNLYGNAYMMGNENGHSLYTRLPYYDDGVICVYVQDGNDIKEICYDTNGNIVSAPNLKIPNKSFYVFEDNIDTYGLNTGNYKGLKDGTGEVVISAKYCEIGTPFPQGEVSEPIVSNGVVLVAIRENDTYYRTEHQLKNFSDGMSGTYTPRYYAYSDLKGNTTFSNSILSKIKDTERLGKQYRDAEVEEERIRKEAEKNKVPEWIEGTWKWSENNSGLGFTYTVNFNRDSETYAVKATGGNNESYSECGTFNYDANNSIINCQPNSGSRAYTYKVDNSGRSIILANGQYLQKSNSSNHYSSYNNSSGIAK